MGQDVERMKIEGERKKTINHLCLAWAATSHVMSIRVRFTILFILGHLLTLFYGWTGSVHRFQW
jgi:hypothetical protein